MSLSNSLLATPNALTPRVAGGAPSSLRPGSRNDLNKPAIHVITTAVFDARPYDRDHLQPAAAGGSIEWRFLEFRLTRDTVPTAKGAQAVCVFVNDQLDRPCLEALAAQGVKLVALRCTGFNNVDLAAAKELKLAVTRVPAY